MIDVCIAFSICYVSATRYFYHMVCDVNQLRIGYLYENFLCLQKSDESLSVGNARRREPKGHPNGLLKFTTNPIHLTFLRLPQVHKAFRGRVFGAALGPE